MGSAWAAETVVMVFPIPAPCAEQTYVKPVAGAFKGTAKVTVAPAVPSVPFVVTPEV